jgi:hypothetical protein
MTSKESTNRKPLLYWVTLATMFAGFIAAVLF